MSWPSAIEYDRIPSTGRGGGTLWTKRQTIHYDSHRKLSLRITLPMSKESSWKALESRVREIASYIWNRAG